MRHSVARFAKTAGTYFVGNVLSKLIAVFLLPIYTAYLAPGEYGTYDVVVSILNIVTPVAFAQIWDGMYRFSFDGRDEKSRYGVVSNSLVVCAIGSAVYTVLFAAVLPVFGNQMSVFMWAYGLTLPLQYEASYIARAFFRNALFSASGVANALIAASMNLILICGYGWGIESIYLSAAVGNLTQIVAISAVLRLPMHFDTKSVSRKLILDMVRFSIPLCLSSLSFWLYNGFTKVCISITLGVDENGLYAVINKFTAAVTMIASVFQFAWNESSYLLANNPRRKDVYGYATEALFLALVSVAVVFPFAVDAVFPFFIDERYQAAAALLPAATVGVAFNSYASFLATIFATEKQTRVVFLSTVGGAVVNVASSAALTGMLGLNGAVVALALSYATVAIIRLVALKGAVGVKLRARTLVPIIPFAAAYWAFGAGADAVAGMGCASCLAICCALGVGDLKRAGLMKSERG